MLKKTNEFNVTKNKLEAFLEAEKPNIASNIDGINITKGKLGSAIQTAGKYIAQDSKFSAHDGMPSESAITTFMSDATKQYAANKMNECMAKGMTEEQAKSVVNDSFDTFVGFDRKNGKYLKTVRVKDGNGDYIKDSILEEMSIPFYNIAYLNKVFRQPYAKIYAENLYQKESFSNAWADVVSVPKATFEGFGKVSSVAKGNIKQNNSNPVSSEASQIVEEVYNISVDYETDVFEDLKAQAKGNFITGQMKGYREQYAKYALDLTDASLRLFGSQEAGITGLVDISGMELYSGTPIYNLYKGTSSTAGAEVLKSIRRVINDFQRENSYMPSQIKINISTYAYEALTSAVYSDQFSPSTPLAELQKEFVAIDKINGVKKCKYEIVADRLCDPNTVFNPNPYDLMFITVPSIEDAMGDQNGLVIAPTLLESYLVPALPVRSGLLYTLYRRAASIIAPIEGTVKVYAGYGWQG